MPSEAPPPTTNPSGTPAPSARLGDLDLTPFTAAGVLEAARYDSLVPRAWRTSALLPGARSAVLLATGGPGFLRACRDAVPDFDRIEDPVDEHTRQAALGVARGLTPGETRCLLYSDRLDAGHADFVALGRACGLGVPSRLGLLLHPRFGPWLAIRVLVLAEKRLDPSLPLDGYAPCEGCPAPCETACHGQAVGPRFDAPACASNRLSDSRCASGCDARRACVVGTEWRYGVEEEAYYAETSLRLVRQASEGRGV